ncbi:MAG: hypothetical protein H6677_27370 [Candidatus Obscuribacterales bacterium]|nr:hypothetical protein [Candidatus Obscuribacterales bacterium]
MVDKEPDNKETEEQVSEEEEEGKEEVLKNLFSEHRATVEMDKPAPTADSDQSQESEPEAEPEPESEPERRVARTMLESESPDLEKLRELAEEVTEKKERVAKTLLETESPDLEKIRSLAEEAAQKVEAEPDEERRVAKTMLEMELPEVAEPLTQSEELQEQDELEASIDEAVSRQTAEAEPERKVSRTLIETDLPDRVKEQLQEKVLEAAREQEASRRNLSTELGKRKIQRSLVDIPASFQLESQADEEAAEPILRRESFVAKTMLDHELILNQLSESMQRLEAVQRKEIEEKERELASQPVKERIPIDNFKMAKPCQWQWEDDGFNDPFRYCGLCKQVVYNFDDVDKPEAMALIYQRENQEKPHLFKRTDGKFMTADCPIAVQRHRFFTMTGMAVGGIFLFLLLLGLLMPKEAPAPAVNQEETVQTEFSGGGGGAAPAEQPSSQPSNSTGDGYFRYNADDPSLNTAPAQPANPGAGHNTPGTAPVPGVDEKGDFWEFPNGEPASGVQSAPAKPQAGTSVYPSQAPAGQTQPVAVPGPTTPIPED